VTEDRIQCRVDRNWNIVTQDRIQCRVDGNWNIVAQDRIQCRVEFRSTINDIKCLISS
jgi:hypothetical protein